MKFVYFGYDFMLPSVLRLIGGGHELAGIMSFECDNVFNFNRDCETLAAERGLPFILSRALETHIEGFLDEGCACFLSAGYPHKIPPVDEARAYGVNVHPAYLPQARGIMPIPRIIMDNLETAAGLSAHKMTQAFDAGDILLQRRFAIGPRETVESYTAKIALSAPEMLSALFADLPRYWKDAAPQDETLVSVFTPPTDQDRLLPWEKGVEAVDAVARAFGRFGSLAALEERLFVVYAHDFWAETHRYAPGTITARTSREIIVAALDGFVVLKEWEEARV